MGNNTDAEYSDLEASIYFYCTFSMSILSVFGTSTIIGTYWYFEDMRSTGRKILVFISTADFLTASGNIMGVTWYICMSRDTLTQAGSEFFCNFHAILTIFSNNCSYCWMIVMALHLYFGICLRKRLWTEKLVIFHIFCWGFPGEYLNTKFDVTKL